MFASVSSASVAPAPRGAPRPIADREGRGDADGSSDDIRIASSHPRNAEPDAAPRRVARPASPHTARTPRAPIRTPSSAHPSPRAARFSEASPRPSARGPSPASPRRIVGGARAARGAILATGANSGVGLSAAKQLAARGETVVLACRTPKRARRRDAPSWKRCPTLLTASLVLAGAGLEMTDLRLVSDYCKAFLDSGIPLDTLVLNAGIMAVPLGRTAQGHEMHFGVNHLAHFLVQDSLVGAMRDRAKSRAASPAAWWRARPSRTCFGALRVNDLDWRAREAAGQYEKWGAYAASKAQNVLLTDEMLAAKPGGANRGQRRSTPGLSPPTWCDIFYQSSPRSTATPRRSAARHRAV